MGTARACWVLSLVIKKGESQGKKGFLLLFFFFFFFGFYGEASLRIFNFLLVIYFLCYTIYLLVEKLGVWKDNFALSIINHCG